MIYRLAEDHLTEQERIKVAEKLGKKAPGPKPMTDYERSYNYYLKKLEENNLKKRTPRK